MLDEKKITESTDFAKDFETPEGASKVRLFRIETGRNPLLSNVFDKIYCWTLFPLFSVVHYVSSTDCEAESVQEV